MQYLIWMMVLYMSIGAGVSSAAQAELEPAYQVFRAAVDEMFQKELALEVVYSAAVGPWVDAKLNLLTARVNGFCE